MKCLHPIKVNPGKGKFTVYRKSDGSRYFMEHCIVPCGQCIACRLNYGKFWSIRMMEELKYHDKACFVTLTYDDEHLNEICEDYGQPRLVKSHLQLFWKRLRKERSVRYFACGEYGDRFGRPHYHAIVYGVGPDECDLIDKHWHHGLVHVGNVTPDSCSYVAKYMTKKLRGQALKQRLEEDPDYQNEFVLMSRRPGIGGEPSAAMIKFMRENGFLYRKDKRSSIPRYYKDKYDIHGLSDDVDFEEFEKHLNNFDNNDKVIRRRLDFFKRR